MTHAAVEQQIKTVPEEYLDEIAEFIDYVLYKANRNKMISPQKNVSRFFGSVSNPIDGLKIQRTLRDEWN